MTVLESACRSVFVVKSIWAVMPTGYAPVSDSTATPVRVALNVVWRVGLKGPLEELT